MNFNLLLAALMLSALPLCASAAPLEDAHTDSPSGEASGDAEEKEETSIEKIWGHVIAPTVRHEKEFKDEFPSVIGTIILDKYNNNSFPDSCPSSNVTKEACLQLLVQGLLKYMVLLKHVRKEYPNSFIVTEVSSRIPLLIALIREKMNNSQQVADLSSSEEQQMLKQLDNPDPFHRKLTAHSILYFLRFFLIDGRRDFRRYN